ncbi:unnamed protein product [Moneuplotes crassus]|uniref:Uncharacterized protein n=1 Tax=Euplotes crassus TaxID=5936 RepID=A0AAD1UNP4_EUPCR|nr:unnamed protein product [Moneuplotes crassus]
MTDQQMKCKVENCSCVPEYYCGTHDYVTCSQCYMNRHYDCDSIQICGADQLHERLNLLRSFSRDLEFRAEQHDLFTSIQGLNEALIDISEVITVLEVSADECLLHNNREELTRLVYQGKKILSDIFNGSLFSNQKDSNPVLRLLFDSQVLDSQKALSEPASKPEGFQATIENRSAQVNSLEFSKEKFEELEEIKKVELETSTTEDSDQKCQVQKICTNEIDEEYFKDQLESEKKNTYLENSFAEKQCKDYLALNQAHRNFEKIYLENRHIRDTLTDKSRDIIEVSNTVFLGDAVGKSSILAKIADQEAQLCQDPTFVFEFEAFKTEFFGRQVCVRNFDISSQQKFHNIGLSFAKSVECIFLIYDITNAKSLERCQSWMNEIPPDRMDQKISYLVGNKADLEDQREVTLEVAAEFRASNGIDFHFEVSAKTGDGVANLAQHLLKHLFVTRHIISPLSSPQDKPKSWFGGVFRR